MKTPVEVLLVFAAAPTGLDEDGFNVGIALGRLVGLSVVGLIDGVSVDGFIEGEEEDIDVGVVV